MTSLQVQEYHKESVYKEKILLHFNQVQTDSFV